MVRYRSSLRTNGGNDLYLLAREEAHRRCKHIKAAQITHLVRLVRQRRSQPPQHRSATLCAVQCVQGPRQFPEGSLAQSRIGQSVQQGHQVIKASAPSPERARRSASCAYACWNRWIGSNPTRCRRKVTSASVRGPVWSAAASVIARLTSSSGSCLIADASKSNGSAPPMPPAAPPGPEPQRLAPLAHHHLARPLHQPLLLPPFGHRALLRQQPAALAGAWQSNWARLHGRRARAGPRASCQGHRSSAPSREMPYSRNSGWRDSTPR